MPLYSPGEWIKTIRTSNIFRVEKPRIEGGMGFVYIAERKKDEKLYALKTLKGGAGNQRKSVTEALLFRQESLVWIILGKHRNIVQAFWFDQDEHYQPLLIVEYIEGKEKEEEGNKKNLVNLRDWLEEKETLDLALAVRFGLEALNGLKYAKDKVKEELGSDVPFIHRDIKPENLLITKDDVLKVTDFGLVMGRGGTPGYMAPEQGKGGAGAQEEKTDVFSLGCVLYRMLEGRRPPAAARKGGELPMRDGRHRS